MKFITNQNPDWTLSQDWLMSKTIEYYLAEVPSLHCIGININVGRHKYRTWVYLSPPETGHYFVMNHGLKITRHVCFNGTHWVWLLSEILTERDWVSEWLKYLRLTCNTITVGIVRLILVIDFSFWIQRWCSSSTTSTWIGESESFLFVKYEGGSTSLISLGGVHIGYLIGGDVIRNWPWLIVGRLLLFLLWVYLLNALLKIHQFQTNSQLL